MDFPSTELSSHIWDAPAARCPGVSQLSNAPATKLPPLVSSETAACQFPLTLPGPDAGTEQLFLVLLLHGTHDFIAPHLSLPGRGVLGQLIIFHTQVIPQLWSSLLLPCSEPFLALLYKTHLSWRNQSCMPYSAHGQWHNDVLCFALFSFLRQG